MQHKYVATTQHKLSSCLKSLLYFSKQSMIMVGHFIQYIKLLVSVSEN